LPGRAAEALAAALEAHRLLTLRYRSGSRWTLLRHWIDATGGDWERGPDLGSRRDPAFAEAVLRQPQLVHTGCVSGASGLRAAQFYLDDSCDDYLRSIRAEALVRRLDVSGSAVVRFAVHRLIEELTPAQVADRLAEPVAERDGTGRKRH
jgi:hypothetical protein